MRKYKNVVGGNCNSNVNVSNYTNPCGSLPLDAGYQTGGRLPFVAHEECIVTCGGKLNKKCISCNINKTSNNKTKPNDLCNLEQSKWGKYERFKPALCEPIRPNKTIIKHNNKKINLIGGSTCNTTPNLSVYDGYSGFEGLRCDGLPLDSAFSNYNMSGGGFFLDVGNPNPVQGGLPPVQGYSECCPPLFSTGSQAGANGIFNDSGYLASTNGNPICGGGRKGGNNRNRKRQSKKNTQSGYTRKGRNAILRSLSLAKTGNAKKNSKKKENGKGISSKKTGKGKKSQKGGDNSIFTGDMSQRLFGCHQPTWDAKCV